jgi:hypothetical protein
MALVHYRFFNSASITFLNEAIYWKFLQDFSFKLCLVIICTLSSYDKYPNVKQRFF